jgi:glutathione synthase/RimK-type ligase-like ATP-grasp enzyme
VVVKPLYGKAGEGVFLAKADDGNFAALIELFLATRREAIQLQAFIPAVFEGDKRIILIEGEPAGVLNRKPQGRDIRSNLAAGGVAEATDLSEADRVICAAIGPSLRERGLVFVGIDVIADRDQRDLSHRRPGDPRPRRAGPHARFLGGCGGAPRPNLTSGGRTESKCLHLVHSLFWP